MGELGFRGCFTFGGLGHLMIELAFSYSVKAVEGESLEGLQSKGGGHSWGPWECRVHPHFYAEWSALNFFPPFLPK